MTIDVSALKQFQKTFGPLLEAIPAVLDSLNAEADLDRALTAKRSEFAAILKKIDESAAQQAQQVQAARDLVAAEQAKLAEVKQSIREERQAADVAAQKAAQNAVDALSALEVKRNTVASDLREIDAVYAVKRAELEKDLTALRSSLEADVDVLIGKKVAAAEALEALRAKLG